jgi:hypothetical protein
MSHKTHTLDRMEKWLLEIIRHPHAIPVALNDPQCQEYQPAGFEKLEDVIEPSKYLSAEDRLGIYADMYFWRLIDILAETYEVLSKSIGEDLFFRLAKIYLIQHPSRSYTLCELGAQLEDFVRTYDEEALPSRDFLAELARLEWAISEVFSAKRSQALDVEQLVKIPNEEWSEAHFDVVEAFQLHSFEYPTNIYWQQFQNNEEKPEIPARRPTWVAVVRRDYMVWRYDINQEQYTLLKAFSEGKTLNESLMACASLPNVNFGTLTKSLTAWFQEWTADGFFARIRTKNTLANC